MSTTGTTGPAAWLASLRGDRLRFAELEGADVGAPVAPCPGWTLADLLAHLGLVHRMAGRMIATPPGAEVPKATERPPEPEARLEWVTAGLAELIGALEDADPATPCRRWSGDTDVRWWLRRQAHETAIHRWDAEVAAGREPTPIDGALAADGVEEWLALQLVRGVRIPDDLRGSIHLHATDVPPGSHPDDSPGAEGGEWVVRLDARLTWDHSHSKGDLAVRGSREQLLLACWGRIDLAQLETFGDPGLWDRLLTALRTADV